METACSGGRADARGDGGVSEQCGQTKVPSVQVVYGSPLPAKKVMTIVFIIAIY